MAIKQFVEERAPEPVFIDDVLAFLETHEPFVDGVQRAQEVCEEMVGLLSKYMSYLYIFSVSEKANGE